MPVKRRIGKRRGTAAELRAWGETFATGYDFGDLEVVGLKGDACTGCPTYQAERRQHCAAERARGCLAIRMPEPAEEATARELYGLAREAWQRLGQRFMATWMPNDQHAAPWAREVFGEPGRTSDAH